MDFSSRPTTDFYRMTLVSLPMNSLLNIGKLPECRLQLSVYLHAFTYKGVYVQIGVDKDAHILACTCTHWSTNVCTCAHTRKQVPTCIHMHTLIHSHAYMLMLTNRQAQQCPPHHRSHLRGLYHSQEPLHITRAATQAEQCLKSKTHQEKVKEVADWTDTPTKSQQIWGCM